MSLRCTFWRSQNDFMTELWEIWVIFEYISHLKAKMLGAEVMTSVFLWMETDFYEWTEKSGNLDLNVPIPKKLLLQRQKARRSTSYFEVRKKLIKSAKHNEMKRSEELKNEWSGQQSQSMFK